MSAIMDGKDRERIRGFLADREEKVPFPQSTRKQYEWWVNAISAYVHVLQHENTIDRYWIADEVKKIKDSLDKVEERVNEYVGNAKAQTTKPAVSETN